MPLQPYSGFPAIKTAIELSKHDLWWETDGEGCRWWAVVSRSASDFDLGHRDQYAEAEHTSRGGALRLAWQRYQEKGLV